MGITVFGDGRQIRAFTHVKDMVNGIVHAMRYGFKGGVYNLGNPANRCSILELAEEVRKISQTTSNIVLVFLDDDVEATPGWLRAIVNFFAAFPHDVMQGSILMREQDRNDPQIRKDLQRYRTIDFIDYGFPPGTELFTLTGGNIAVRRMVFDRVGLFNERLGPGQTGISEDVEYAKRVTKSGLKIGYEPRAAVYNEMDKSRLSEKEFRRRHEAQGRSRLAYKNNSIFFHHAKLSALGLYAGLVFHPRRRAQEVPRQRALLPLPGDAVGENQKECRQPALNRQLTEKNTSEFLHCFASPVHISSEQPDLMQSFDFGRPSFYLCCYVNPAP